MEAMPEADDIHLDDDAAAADDDDDVDDDICFCRADLSAN